MRLDLTVSLKLMLKPFHEMIGVRRERKKVNYIVKILNIGPILYLLFSLNVCYKSIKAQVPGPMLLQRKFVNLLQFIM